MTKRYYWLKLKEDFFRAKEIKKLRRIAGGDTYTIIYLKMLLISLRNDGKLYFDGVEDTFVEELALEIDEDEDNVRVAVAFLLKVGLMTMVNEDTAFMTAIPEMIDSETDKAALMRRKRHREKQAKELEEGNVVTNVGNVVTNNGNNVTEELPGVTFCFQEIDIDIEKEKEKDNICAKKNNELEAEAMFERLWDRYPRKRGKGNVKKSKKLALYKIGESKLSQALDRFLADMKGQDMQYIPYGSTWFNSGYVDYLGENYTPQSHKKSVKPSDRSQMTHYRSQEEAASIDKWMASIEE